MCVYREEQVPFLFNILYIFLALLASITVMLPIKLFEWMNLVFSYVYMKTYSHSFSVLYQMIWPTVFIYEAFCGT